MKFNSKQLRQMSDAVKADALRAIRAAGSGHIGIVLDAADVVTTIYTNHLRDTDTFVLSAGHGSALLYSVLRLPKLESFRKLGGLPGHPEFGTRGVAATTGPLGQGVGNAVGYALAAKIKKSNGRVYCLCSDGDLMEGVAQEAIAFAGRQNLNNLVLLWDDNGISMDGTVLTDIDVPMRMAAAGFDVYGIDGNNFEEVNYALTLAARAQNPVFIQSKTVLGAGSSVANTPAAHGLAIDDAELDALIARFDNVDGRELLDKTSKLNVKSSNNNKTKTEHYIFNHEHSVLASTREISGEYLKILVPQHPEIIGGSADLATSTNTHVPGAPYVEYGVREHAMGAIMNGMAAVGLRPYGATFLAFSDYMRPAIRLAALSKLPTIFVFTHDSIAVGPDGPTHQPVEQIASLRLIPNLNVFRPCNAAEVKWAWDTALADTSRPSCIILSRQKFEQIDTPTSAQLNNGAYMIYRVKKPTITLIATGSEVPLAVAVAKLLGNANVVSMPSVERFRTRGRRLKNELLSGFVVAIETGATAGWFEFADAVVGIDTFGTTGDGDAVYKHFGFDADTIASQIAKQIKK